MEPPFDDPRIAPLWPQLRPGQDPCPLVAAAADAPHVRLTHYDAGRDVVYVFVLKASGKPTSPPDQATISYAPQVPGTDLIYDVSAATLQGKARPFDCNLKGRLSRFYAILPVQLEEIAVKLHANADGPRIEVAFRDASGERLEGAFPFLLKLLDREGREIRASHETTDRSGEFLSPAKFLADAPRGARIVVRSELTGEEKSLDL